MADEMIRMLAQDLVDLASVALQLARAVQDSPDLLKPHEACQYAVNVQQSAASVREMVEAIERVRGDGA